MEGTFLSVLNASITAGWLVLAVMVLRLIFQKAPKSIRVLMWALVAIRLLLPFRFESALSLIPSAEPVPQEFLVSSEPHVQTGIPVINHAVNPVLEETLAPAPEDVFFNTPARNIAQIAALVWLVGVVLMLCYAAFSYLRIRKSVREAMSLKDRLWLCDRIATPFILGILRPRIYLPSHMDPADMTYVIAHEKAHLKRKDHWWKPLGFGLLSIHWFNPLLWLGYILLCRDIELACDEAVLRKMGTNARKPYSEALLNCSLPRRFLAACPLAFGEVGVKTRIRSVLSYKKPTLWIILASLVTCAALAVGFLTNPKTEPSYWAQAFLESTIINENRSEDSHRDDCYTEFKILESKKWGADTTYYLLVYYAQYTEENGLLQEQTASFMPTVITLRDNSFLKEYWIPRDGTYYRKDIRRKFPIHLWSEVLDSQRYVNELQAGCKAQAWEHLKQTTPESTPNQLTELENKYPQYFGLNTDKGLEVYVWQMAADRYRWGLTEGRDLAYTQTELMQLQGISLDEIQTIVASYDLRSTEVSVHPIVMPHSSYLYTIDLAYQQKVEQLFWGDFPGITVKDFGVIIDTMTFDVDGDGKDEVCHIGPGPTSGVYSFTFTATEDGEPEYYNVFTGAFYYLSFEKMPGGAVRLRGVTQGADPEIHYFKIGVDANKNITLSGANQFFMFLDPPSESEKTEPKLTLAISAAVQNRPPETPGNICTESYIIFDRLFSSGTPLVGETEHKNTVTVCLALLRAEYSLLAGYPENVIKHYIPTYITFDIDDQGNYTLSEYCDDYRKVMEKFPNFSFDTASNHDKYLPFLQDNCDRLAREKHHWQQGTVSETYDFWKLRYDLAMEVKDFS